MSQPYPLRTWPNLTSEYSDPERYQLDPELLCHEPAPDPATDPEAAIQYLIDGTDPEIEAYAFVSTAVQRHIAAEKLGLAETDEAYEAALRRARTVYHEHLYEEAKAEDRQWELRKQRRMNRASVSSEPLVHYFWRHKQFDRATADIQTEPLVHFKAVYPHVGRLTAREARMYAPVHYQIAANVGKELGSLLIGRLDERLPESEQLQLPSKRLSSTTDPTVDVRRAA